MDKSVLDSRRHDFPIQNWIFDREWQNLFWKYLFKNDVKSRTNEKCSKDEQSSVDQFTIDRRVCCWSPPWRCPLERQEHHLWPYEWSPNQTSRTFPMILVSDSRFVVRHSKARHRSTSPTGGRRTSAVRLGIRESDRCRARRSLNRCVTNPTGWRSMNVLHSESTAGYRWESCSRHCHSSRDYRDIPIRDRLSR